MGTTGAISNVGHPIYEALTFRSQHVFDRFLLVDIYIAFAINHTTNTSKFPHQRAILETVQALAGRQAPLIRDTINPKSIKIQNLQPQLQTEKAVPEITAIAEAVAAAAAATAVATAAVAAEEAVVMTGAANAEKAPALV